MTWNEFRQPLRKRGASERLWAKRPSLFVVAVTLVCASYGTAIALMVKSPVPFAGEPVRTAQIPPPELLKTPAPRSEAAGDGLGEQAQDLEVSDTATAPDESLATATTSRTSSGSDDVVIISGSTHQPLRAAPIAALSEKSAEGLLPRIGSNNAKPLDAYARPVPMSVAHSGRPKIAIVLGGMGLNEALTRQATSQLPGDVTFAFAPYGDHLQTQVNAARTQGHEVMLQLPMEPLGYPTNNPGPKTLLVGADPSANLADLKWHMSRFSGYTGVINYLGSKMLASGPAMQPVLNELQRRGLLYLEDGGNSLTASQQIAVQIKLPVRRSQINLDSDPSPEAIKAALELLEKEALTNGSAIGTGSGLGVTIDTIDEWSKTLLERGILLVPASSLYKSRLG